MVKIISSTLPLSRCKTLYTTRGKQAIDTKVPRIGKINLNIRLLVFALMVTLTGQAAGGATITVANYGRPSDFTSIQPAVNAASNGDEIEVLPGTYNETINFNEKSIRLYSSGIINLKHIHSIPVGVLQITSMPENLCSWLKTSGYGREGQYIPTAARRAREEYTGLFDICYFLNDNCVIV